MASNLPEEPIYAAVFIKSEPPPQEEEQSVTSTSDNGFRHDSIVKDELIIEDDPEDKDMLDDEEFKATRIKYLPDGSIECHECGKIIPDYKSYVQHIRRHRNIRLRRFHCKPCNKIFLDKGNLVRHDQRFHSEQKDAGASQDEESGRKPATDEEVKPKAEVLEQKDLFKCSGCKKTFQKRYLAVAHVERHENLRKELFKCSTCGKCFASKSALTPHERAHQVMKAAAPPPSARAKSPIEIMRHDAVAFKCAECGLFFAKRKAYFRHARRHDIIKRGEFQCQICGKYLGARSELDKHLEMHERNRTSDSEATAGRTAESLELICGTCGKLLSSYRNFRRHMQRHKDVENGTHRCNQCGHYFATKNSLKVHLNSNGHSQQTTTTTTVAEERSDSKMEECSSEEMILSDTQPPVSKPAKPKLVLKKIVIKKADE